jgi:very-short-patch-repair endonuclease
VLRLEDLPHGTQADLASTLGFRPGKRKSKNSEAADLFAFQLRARSINDLVREHRFAQQAMGRDWRFDFAHLRVKLAVEIEGLVVRRIGGQTVCMGRHATIDGYREDCVKYNAAQALGWCVLRFEQSMVKSGHAIDTVEKVLQIRGWKRRESV